MTDYVSRLPHICAVYILSSPSRSMNVGATTDLERRVFEHKTRVYEESHTARYKIARLVWYESHEDWNHAHSRELELKGWTREKKIRLFQEQNPRWLDLSYGMLQWSSTRFR